MRVNQPGHDKFAACVNDFAAVLVRLAVRAYPRDSAAVDDDVAMLKDTSEFLAGLNKESVHEVDILPYHKLGVSKYGEIDKDYSNIDFDEPEDPTPSESDTTDEQEPPTPSDSDEEETTKQPETSGSDEPQESAGSDEPEQTTAATTEQTQAAAETEAPETTAAVQSAESQAE